MDKKIILGVTGGIAVYKSADLCSTLVKEGFDVQVVMTPNAAKLISPVIFKTLSKREVALDIFDPANGVKPLHIEVANFAPLAVIAPATANFIAKYTYGIADEVLSCVMAAFTGRVLLAPAMNPAMYQQPVCCENREKLAQRGVEFVGPDDGRVACGAPGTGRLAGVADIIDKINLIYGK